MPTNSISDPAERLLRPLREHRLSWPVWLAFAYAGVVLPVICHAMTVAEPPGMAGRDGKRAICTISWRLC